MNRHRSLLTALLFFVLVPALASAQPSLYRQTKAFGPVPLNAISFHVGFLDGPDHYYLTRHLNEWANQRQGGESWDNWATSFHSRVGYRRQISPKHVVATSFNYSFLSADGRGDYIASVDSLIPLTTERTLNVHLLSLDLGFQYFMNLPAPRQIAPYMGGGFSVFFPLERLKTTSRLETGEIFPNPGETISENSYEAGIYGEFGIIYFLSNRYAAGLEGRYQMSQSRFFIHDGNFVVDYAGVCLSMTMLYFF